MATKKASAKKTAAKRVVVKKTVTKKAAARSHTTTPKGMPKEGKNPKGGLTAKGRKFFNRTEGSHLRPGVTGAADTPEKMKRKGSFLRRHFTHPRGPMQDEKGNPTRLALSAHAWGEPVPKDMAAAKKLAAKGHALLEKYHATQDSKADGKASPKKSTAMKNSTAKTSAGKASTLPRKQTAAKKATAKKASQR